MSSPLSLVVALTLLTPSLPAAGEEPESPAPADTAPSAAEAAAEGTEIVEEIEEVAVAPAVKESYGDNYARTDRIYGVMLARTARRGSTIITINHRANEAISKDAWFDYAGLDGGSLKIGLGARYGVLDALDVGVFRVNGTVEVFDTYEFDARYQVLSAAQIGFDLAVRGGLTWFSQKHAEDASGYFGQLLVDRVFADEVVVGGGLLYHSSSSNDKKTDADPAHSLAAALYTEYRFIPALAVDAEVCGTLSGYHSEYPAFTAGIKGYTDRHTFSLFVSNTQYMGADGMVAGTWRGKPESFIIGFNITREL
ncbi:MAG: hypothetical protein HY903_08660 [Deltaproteobacteria bacterium]|nr:hypothetical protein [Deltaproteobacteria bacterium]